MKIYITDNKIKSKNFDIHLRVIEVEIKSQTIKKMGVKLNSLLNDYI